MRLPKFSLRNQSGDTVTDADIGRAVLFFYPAASTPGCTVESCDFRDRYDGFQQAGYAVYGVSPDQPAANARFREEHGFPFDLLSDEDHALADALGAWGLKKNYGREYEGLIRSTFVIDEDGVVEKAYRNVKAAGHVARVAADLLVD